MLESQMFPPSFSCCCLMMSFFPRGTAPREIQSGSMRHCFVGHYTFSLDFDLEKWIVVFCRYLHSVVLSLREYRHKVEPPLLRTVLQRSECLTLLRVPCPRSGCSYWLCPSFSTGTQWNCSTFGVAKPVPPTLPLTPGSCVRGSLFRNCWLPE